MSKQASLNSAFRPGWVHVLLGEENGATGLATIAVVVVALGAAWSAWSDRGRDFAPPDGSSLRVAQRHLLPVLQPDTCANCGVVVSVVEVQRRVPVRGAAPLPSYQLRVRMADGSVRQVEQAGGLAAGAHVIVEGSAVRPAAGSRLAQG